MLAPSSRNTGQDSTASETCGTPVAATSLDAARSRSAIRARTSPPRTRRARATDSLERNLASGCKDSASSENSAQLTLWLRTSPETGAHGCPSCDATCGPSGMPACRFTCEPMNLEPLTRARESSLLPTPTATANQCAPSMRKHPACRRLQDLTGTGGRPHPEVFAWMMGFPEGWAVINSDATGTP